MTAAVRCRWCRKPVAEHAHHQTVWCASHLRRAADDQAEPVAVNNGDAGGRVA